MSQLILKDNKLDFEPIEIEMSMCLQSRESWVWSPPESSVLENWKSISNYNHANELS